MTVAKKSAAFHFTERSFSEAIIFHSPCGFFAFGSRLASCIGCREGDMNRWLLEIKEEC